MMADNVYYERHTEDTKSFIFMATRNDGSAPPFTGLTATLGFATIPNPKVADYFKTIAGTVDDTTGKITFPFDGTIASGTFYFETKLTEGGQIETAESGQWKFK